jgi:hypothetical protein
MPRTPRPPNNVPPNESPNSRPVCTRRPDSGPGEHPALQDGVQFDTVSRARKRLYVEVNKRFKWLALAYWDGWLTVPLLASPPTFTVCLHAAVPNAGVTGAEGTIRGCFAQSAHSTRW